MLLFYRWVFNNMAILGEKKNGCSVSIRNNVHLLDVILKKMSACDITKKDNNTYTICYCPYITTCKLLALGFFLVINTLFDSCFFTSKFT